ncbi:hypothetical protein [[Flexibacter] sp. ATCC 35208]|uniref:hypothetical protein n=1 Tax=[Flexibacter] sp. ATCC 35208 TaxID=1936242 RepID=UPI0009C53DFC|nr:hypothetical protein [[Flexibacter] sp. ATCC 35208]OMP74588.1 hypothetical protein BW716_34595 [[Flexibacter] sp. ATCC 35208]
MFRYLLISTLVIVIYCFTGCTYSYKAGNLIDLDYPVETPLRAELIMQYFDTLAQKRGYAVPEKWKSLNKLIDLDSIDNKRIYFEQGPEEMYLISFGGMLVLSDVYNPNIRAGGYIADSKLMSPAEEKRVLARFQHEILDTIEAMAKRDGVPDSVLYMQY